MVVHDEGNPDEHAGAHIARHDPARVLRGVQAKRRVVEDRETSSFILRLLASEWSDHADYRKEWTIEGVTD